MLICLKKGKKNSRFQFIGRVAATLALAAVSIAITIPVSRLLGHQAERTRGMISLLAIVIGFLIWKVC